MRRSCCEGRKDVGVQGHGTTIFRSVSQREAAQRPRWQRAARVRPREGDVEFASGRHLAFQRRTVTYYPAWVKIRHDLKTVLMDNLLQ